MSKKLLLSLVAITAVAAALAFTLSRESISNGELPSGLLLPQLAAQVNDIDWVRVTSGSKTIATARREGEAWVIEEAAGYRADWDVLQALLSGLASARVVEPKTANPDYYDRLGVQDPALPDAPGVLVEFRPETGLPGVIIGNRPQGRDGQYLRLADGGRAMLVDRELDAPKTTEAWMQREVVDIADDEVVEIAITHPGENVIVARKVSADDENFVLQDVPEGRQPKSDWAVNRLAGGFSSLRAEAVRPADEIDWTGAVRYRVVTADGLLLEAQALTPAASEGEEQGHWVQLEAGVYTTALDSATGEDNAAMTTGRAEEINDRVRGWAYRIPESAYDTMTAELEGLLEIAAGVE